MKKEYNARETDYWASESGETERWTFQSGETECWTVMPVYRISFVSVEIVLSQFNCLKSIQSSTSKDHE